MPTWKKGRGKLGPLAPLIGTWRAEADSPVGSITCTRTFTSILGGKYIQLDAEWLLPQGSYRERALIGVNAGGSVGFWSFTSDGKQSAGTLADVTDIHPEAVGFEAQMPAGLARMAYWQPRAMVSTGSSSRGARRAGTASQSTTIGLFETSPRGVPAPGVVDRRAGRVLQYPSLAGRPVWPARDRCEKPHPSYSLIATRDPRRAHRSADTAEASSLRETDATLRTEDWKHRFRRG
jgi:hypothetical protein